MTRASKITAVNCTSCGAGLDVLGGGRVKVHVCPYCGTELDAQADYAVLRKHVDMPRPESPFRIGMTGEIEGVTFTIIGTLGYRESWGGKIWRWTDHQLYSPTHGYAYLTVEDGHLSFTRRFRGAVSPGWLTPWAVEVAEGRPKIWAGGKRYDYYDTGTPHITFVEGEFNWTPEIGEQPTVVTLMSDDAKLGLSATDNERELYRTIYLPHAETCASFGASEPGTPSGTHPLQPYRVGAHEVFLRFASIGLTLLCLILSGVVLPRSSGTTIANGSYSIEDLPIEVPMTLTIPERLARVSLTADVTNSWAFIGAVLYDPEDQPVFEIGRTLERYSGRDQDGSWSEGNGTGRFFFRPEVAGEHVLELSLEESETWQREGAPLSRDHASRD